MNNFYNKNRSLFLALLISGFFILMVLPGIHSPGLWDRDEAYYAEVARQIDTSNNWLVPGFNNSPFFEKPIFTYWMIAAAYRLFGVSEFSARIFSALFSVGTVFLVFFLGKMLFDFRAGYISALILCTSLFFGIISRVALMDAYFVFFLTGTLLFFLKTVTPGKNKLLFSILCFAFAGFATLTKGPAGVFLPLVTIMVYLAVTKQLKQLFSLNYFIGILVFVLVAIPWYISVNKLTGGEFMKEFLFRQNITRFFQPAQSHSGPVWFYVPALFLGFLPWVVFLPQAVYINYRKHRESFYFLASWVLVIFVFFSMAATKLPHYILPLYPALALLAGKLWSEFMFGSKELRDRIWATSGISLLLLLFTDIAGLLAVNALLKLSPGVVPWALPVNIGLLFAGNILSIVLLMSLKNIKACFYSIIATVFAFFIFLNICTIPQLNSQRVIKPLAEAVTRQIGEGDDILAFRFFEPGMVFYTKHFINRTDSISKLNDFVCSEKRVFVFISEKDYIEVKNEIKCPIYMLYRKEGFSEDKGIMTLFLISNRE